MSQQKGQQEMHQDQGIPPKQDPLANPQPQPGYPQPQPGYPQPQPGYPQPQPGYPQPQPGYPQPQPGYPQPQPGYQSGYSTQPDPGYQPGYSQPQGYYPPPTYTYPQEPQQQLTTIIVTQQPAAAEVDPSPLPRSSIFGKTKNFYFTESLMLSLIFCLFGGCPALCCTVPAIFLSLSAQKAYASGNTSSAISKATTAHRLIVAALIYAVIGYIGYIFFVVVVPVVVVVVANAAVQSSYG